MSIVSFKRWFQDWLPQSVARVRTPNMLQTEPHECGVVCLAVILAFHGVHQTLSRLRRDSGTGREGFRLDYLAKTARTYGLKSRGLAIETGKLATLPLPFIALWNFQHLVVVEGVGQKVCFLNDPAKGRIRVQRKTFDEAFSGVVLVFSKEPHFKPVGHPQTVMSGLLRRLQGSRTPFLFVVLSSLGLIIPGWLLPTFIRQFVDSYLTDRQEYWLIPLMIGMGLTVVLRGVFTLLQQSSLARLQTKLAMSWGSSFFWKMLRLPLDFFSERSHGDLSNRFKYADRMAGLVAGQLTMGLMNLISLVFYGAIMAQYHLGLACMSFVTMGLGWGLLGHRLVETGLATEKWYLQRGNFLGSALNGLKLKEQFKTCGTEGVLFNQLVGRHSLVIGANQRLERQRIFMRAGILSFDALHGVLVLVYGAHLIMSGEFTVGTLIAYQTLAVSFSIPVIAIIGLSTRLYEAKAMLTGIDEVMTHPNADEFSRVDVSPSLPLHSKVLHKPFSWRGQIEIRDLSFSFSPFSPPVLDKITLSIAAGSRVALVGSSGSGRSTLGRLIAGLYDPSKGQVLFDGRPLQSIPRKEFRSHIAMLEQSGLLFDTSLRSNLSLWDDTLPEEDIVAAAKAAMIHEVILERPGGYDHVVSGNGSNFSSGECQRLELARVLAIKPTVLIMDESTSSMDALIETQVMENIRRLGITCIFIAHRLSTIRDCDLIVVLENGRVVEEGNHESLIELGNRYHRLITSW